MAERSETTIFLVFLVWKFHHLPTDKSDKLDEGKSFYQRKSEKLKLKKTDPICGVTHLKTGIFLFLMVIEAVRN